MGQSETGWQRALTLPVGYHNPVNGLVARKVTLRKMTGKEEVLMADPSLQSNGGKLITALLTNCIIALEGVHPVDAAVVRQLTSADRNFLLLELRRLTFGDEMEARYRCPYCPQAVSTSVLEDLSTLEVKEMDDGDTGNIQVVIRDGYQDPDGNWHYELVFGLPTGADEEVAASRPENNAARQRDALLARCLTKVGELEEKRIRAMGIRILADLSMGDRQLIQQTIDASAPGPDLIRTVQCIQCGEAFRTALDMSRFFSLG